MNRNWRELQLAEKHSSRAIKLETEQIRRAEAGDAVELEAILNQVFGPGRFARTSYRIREQSGPDPRLSFVAEAGTELVGAVYFTPVATPQQSGALLLGPLVVKPEYARRQIGSALVQHGLNAAQTLGYRLVLLIGDWPYFRRLGFRQVPSGQLTLPGPVNPARFLYFELQEQALDDFTGPLQAIAPPYNSPRL